MQFIFLALLTLFVGFLCGCTSIGGVLLLPAMDACTDLGLRKVTGTALLSFFFSGLLGTWLHMRSGLISFRAALPLCAGAALTGFAGAFAKEHVPVAAISTLLAVIIIMAGIVALKPPSAVGGAHPSGRKADIGLFALGAAVSFVSCMTGAGGPVLSVPLMIIMGYAPLLAVTVAQPFQVIVTLSGSVGNVLVDSIDYRMTLFITVLLLAGVGVGVFALRFFKADMLRKAVALLCIGTGAYTLARTFL